MNAQLLKRMIRSHHARDEQGFADAVRQMIAAERRRGHARAADELEAALGAIQGTIESPRDSLATVHRLPHGRAEEVSFVEVRTSTRTRDDIVMAEETSAAVTRFLHEYSHRARLTAHGLAPARKLLFHGPPGNGKTLCAEVVAGELGLPLYYVRFDALIVSYLGETAANLRKAFDLARRRPGVLFFDEVDAIARTRDDQDDVGELKRVVNSFLQMLDGDASEGPIIAATNHGRSLDEAIWRRFDDVIFFPKPDRAQLEAYLARRLRVVSTHGISLAEAAELCSGLCLSDVARVVSDALKTMVLEHAKSLTVEMLGSAVSRMRAARRRRGQTPDET